MKREENISLHFGLKSGRGGGGGGNQILERENFSLDFPPFAPSVLVGLRSKVVLRCKGYAWAPVLGSFDNFGR